MAEAREEVTTVLPEGRVEEVRRQFSVREDGALAYRIQNEEIEEHYGMNRLHRRTVRGDIPVAKVVQSQEEIEQQKERLRKLAALQAQAEADEIVARRINRQVQDEVKRDEMVRAIEDEELARQLQDKEKVKYEKYLQKKRERKLKKEREKLEQQLAKTTEEARLAVAAPNGNNVEQARQDMEAMRLQGAGAPVSNGVTRYHYRVTPGGRIEDDGDFSDFFAVPPDNLHPEEWEKMQQQQDEELARLLQEQEHKRSKAEVDKNKLREIEMRDEQLAAIMQEQERLKEKKYKQKRQQQKEQQKLERQHSGQDPLPLGASANMLSQMHTSPTNADHNHHRYRRNSYTKSIDNGPAPLEYDPDEEAEPRGIVLRTGMGREGAGSRNDPDRRPQMPPPQGHAPPMHRTVIEVTNPNPHLHPHPRTPSSQPPPRRQGPSAELSPDDAPEVLRWLQSQGAPVEAPAPDFDPRRGRQPSPVHDPCDEEVSGLSRQAGFNIATAIDPTYHRRQTQSEEPQTTQVKTTVPVSRSLPLADTPSSADGSYNDNSFDDGTGAAGFQPVQGQKRSTLDSKNRKARASGADAKGGKNSNCKQQ
ncbi:uncharacterized protein LOC143287197 [Babylonia areolata]|uniref:uncharacterized protein LOC143287197 n=1 Tax=Babylonia areolata TaxID=304850 RepID=UPI003FD1B2BB